MKFNFVYIYRKQLAKVIAIILFIAITFVVYYVKKDESRDSWSLVAENDGNTASDEHEIQGGEAALHIIVDIDGEVLKPSVYILPLDSRIYEAVEAAGGLTDDADTRHINLAAPLEDGTKLYIPSKKQDEEKVESRYFIESSTQSSSDLINLNKADSSLLQQLPRIGPSTAEKILCYRNEYGGFKTKEELMNVSGIGQKTYESLKNLITVE